MGGALWVKEGTEWLLWVGLISAPPYGRRTLQLLRENLEEEAIIMKDVPDWKVRSGLGWGGVGWPAGTDKD